MQVKRIPGDAQQVDVEVLFARWSDEMDALDAAYAAPRPEPLVPGTAPGRPVGEAWKAEMRKRTDLLHPLAREMADTYRHRLDEAGRQRVRMVLASHSPVVWQFIGAIDDYFDRFLQSLARDDLDVALTLTAIYDLRAGSREFQWSMYQVFTAMEQRGLDPRTLFGAGIPLAARHEDPHSGAYGLFTRLANAPRSSPMTEEV
ncbi:hypothetical protein [Kitasatospora sp. NPDC051914]|uniref:hypothetical protein n=1 Tax=Kitasatospora sp. NPDC051914 TaxID=3154945 RepID=UPI0034178A4F